MAACTVEDVERWAAALGGHVTIDLRVDGGPPLADAQHAKLQNWLSALLRSHGWAVAVERSFNHYGDRGRIDVLALHPLAKALLVVEVKSRVVDVQELLGSLDVKRRVAARTAAELGWNDATTTVPMIVVQEQRTNRRRVTEHAVLFAAFPIRGRTATAWLRQPKGQIPAGLLLFAAPA